MRTSVLLSISDKTIESNSYRSFCFGSINQSLLNVNEPNKYVINLREVREMCDVNMKMREVEGLP